MPVWLAWLGGLVLNALRKPEQIATVVMAGGALAHEIDVAIHDEPGTPVSRATEEHIRAQVDAATSHKVAPSEPCALPPAGWSCSRGKGHDGPCAASPVPPRPIAKTQPRATVRPPRPPRMKGKQR
jgi:hypothetical protein